MRNDSRGFSLIELLIVVAIILIIAAIAIPDLLKSRQAANQASAVGSLRVLNTSETTYAAIYTVGYSPTLMALDGNANPATPASAGLIDSVLGNGIKSGYGFSYVVNPPTPAVPVPCTATPTSTGTPATPPATNTGFAINASPLQCANSGNYYFMDHSGVIHMNNTTEAGPADNPLAG